MAALPFALLVCGCTTLASWCVRLDPAKTTGLDDDFNGPTLAKRWRVLNKQTFELSVREGALHIKPTRKIAWWRKDNGPLLYQQVTGNFRVTVSVRARKATDPAQAPDTGYQFGGVIARDPQSDASGSLENYVFAVVGYRGNYLCVENKTTRENISYVDGPEWKSGDAELRICRVNARFHLYRRPIGGERWEKTITYKRPDLPPKLQVGPIAYALTDKFDLKASFDWIRYAPVTSVEDCTKD